MTKPAASPGSFEGAITELEDIVRAMESGQISLEQALDHYQRGVGLLRYCRDTLNNAEQRVRQLEGDQLVDVAAPEKKA
ncbi:MAG: exodeoxyribonuclease VII small subunit [Zoogloeaceae bacterium]|nr:exodeoxyribonuclease VII small subunit [Zoogloeaceae bacterium]